MIGWRGRESGGKRGRARYTHRELRPRKEKPATHGRARLEGESLRELRAPLAAGTAAHACSGAKGIAARAGVGGEVEARAAVHHVEQDLRVDVDVGGPAHAAAGEQVGRVDEVFAAVVAEAFSGEGVG